MADNFSELMKDTKTFPKFSEEINQGKKEYPDDQSAKNKDKVLKVSGKNTYYIQRNKVKNYIRLLIRNNER